MKLKFYLRGLGVGVLVTTLILTVSNDIRNGQAALKENPSTVASVLSSSRAETKASNAEQTTEQKKETVAVTKAEVVTQAPTQAETQAATEKATEATTAQKAEVTNQPITVVLSDISNSEGAAQAIAKAGVLDSWTDFNKYLESSGYAVKIHNGTYTLYKGQDYESIAKIITGK